MAYDPKRPRPAAQSDEPAPVDALLDASETDEQAVVEEAVIEELTDASETVDLTDPVVLGGSPPDAGSNGSTTSRTAQRQAPEVPVAPAPETGTTNRAVLAAALGGTALVGFLVILWCRRRGANSST